MSTKKENFGTLIEFYYFYTFLLKFFNFLSYKSNNNMSQLLKFNNNFLFILKFLLNFNTLTSNYKKINKYLNFKINYKFNTFNNFKFNENKSIKNFKFIDKNMKTEYKLFNLFFLFNYSMFNSHFKVNHNFNLFYIYSYTNKLILIDVTKFLFRWKESYDLIFNIFYYNFNPLVFGSNLFKNETLALNWNYNTFDINLWRYYFPFFIFKLNNYNKKTSFFFDKLFTMDINFFFITDCHYHYKNLYYIKKKNYYSVGLVNINLDPWLVSYPILTFFENFLTQVFFFKLLIFIERKVFFSKYSSFKNIWLQFLYTTYNKNTV